MSSKAGLRERRTGTVINATAKQQESSLIKALYRVENYLNQKFSGNIRINHRKIWFLKDIVSSLCIHFPEIEFHTHSDKTHMKPDGGILCLESLKNDGSIYPILISEVKNQGTNDLRLEEGKDEQASGNAIERLGKNVIGFRIALLHENIFPFVCFGYGYDFRKGSSILDRVTTIAMFGKLNKTYLNNEENGKFNRGSFYFRRQEWEEDEMFEVMKDISVRSIYYYFSKYGENNFIRQPNNQ